MIFSFLTPRLCEIDARGKSPDLGHHVGVGRVALHVLGVPCMRHDRHVELGHGGGHVLAEAPARDVVTRSRRPLPARRATSS
jgi:hypothetical protein